MSLPLASASPLILVSIKYRYGVNIDEKEEHFNTGTKKHQEENALFSSASQRAGTISRKKNPFEKGSNQSRVWTLEYRRIFPLHLVSAIHGIACLVHTKRLTGFTIAATSRKKKRSGFPTLKNERLGNFVSKIATLCGIRKEQLAVRFGVKLKLEQNW